MELLKKIIILENEADKFGFSWEKPQQIIDQIQSECLEIMEHLEPDANETNELALQEEVGDLLHAAFSLCIFLKLNPEETLKKTIDKFDRRLSAVKQITRDSGLNDLKGKSFDELMQIWRKAKQLVG